MNLRVLHLLKTGIGARWALHQVRELVRLGIDVHVAMPDGPMQERFNAVGAVTHRYQTDIAAYRPWQWRTLFRDLRQLVDTIEPDLIHSHFVGTTATMRLALTGCGVPRIFQVPGPLHLEHPLYARAELAIAAPQDHWIAACRWTRDTYRRLGIGSRRVHLSYYTTDVAAFAPRPDDGRLRQMLGLSPNTRVAGMVAYCYPPKRHLGQRRGLKGHEDFIDAIARCRKTGQDLVGVIVGGAWGGAHWYEQQVHAYATTRCPGGIRFLGTRDDVRELYAAFDLAVHPSLSENVGGALESALMAVPTITTDVGGFPDLIVPGKTGWLVPPQNPAALARCILQVLRDGEVASQVAQRARQQALEQFSPVRLGREIHDIYLRVLGARA